MIEDVMDKYIKESETVDAVNSVVHMDISEIVDNIVSKPDSYKEKILKMLDEDKRKDIKKLIDGGMI